MCSTALGAGVVPPFDSLYSQAGLIFASAVSAEFKARMRRASVNFNDATAAEESALRRRAQQLESDIAADVPGAFRELSAVREEMDSLRYAFCHDAAARKDLIVEMIKKSRHKHVSVLDDEGFRLSMSLKLSQTFAAECSLMQLTVSHGMNQALNRINGTGEVKSVLVSAGINPAFTYFASPPTDLVKRLADKLSKSTILTPLKGRAVIISEPPLRRATLTASAETIQKLLDTYYVLGHLKVEDRASFVMDAGLKTEWENFLLDCNVFEMMEIPENRRERADRVLHQYYILPEVAAAFATRAALCQAILENLGPPLKIALTRKHLALAKEFFKVFFTPMMTKVSAADKLSDNAAKARATRAAHIPSPSRQEAALDELRKAIIESPTSMISRRTATRLPGVTNALLDYLVSNNTELVELLGRSASALGNRTERAYGLRTMEIADTGEALDDYDEASAVYRDDPNAPMFDNMENVRHALMKLARDLDRGVDGLPAIPITRMTSNQIRCLPAILHNYPDCFVMRGTLAFPELPHLVKSVTDPDAPLEPDVPNVWVRRDATGKDLRDWALAVKLGFADVWKPFE